MGVEDLGREREGTSPRLPGILNEYVKRGFVEKASQENFVRQKVLCKMNQSPGMLLRVPRHDRRVQLGAVVSDASRG